MSTEPHELRKEIEDLKAAQAAQVATQAGAMTTMTAMNAGTIATVAAGGVSLVVGMVLGIVIARMSPRWR